MSKFLSVFLLLSTSSAFAVGDKLECKNLNGSVKYESVRIMLGVPPRPGERRSWQTLTVNRRSYDGGKVTLTNQKQLRKPKKTRTQKTEWYSATLIAREQRVNANVSCVDSKYIGPPPPIAPPRGGTTGGGE